MNQNKQQGFPIIPGMGLPGQRESRRSDSKSDFDLPLRQWCGVIVLFTLCFLLIVANVLIIGPLVGYVAGIVSFLFLLVYGYALVHRQEQPVPALVSIIGLVLVGFWILAGYNITERFWWNMRCNWEPRNKLLFVLFSAPFIALTFLPVYRFAQEIIDPNWSPTISIRPAEWGVLWPWKQLPREESEDDELEQYSAPRQTPIDEVDERGDNGSPKLMRLSWLPISPEETQRLCVAVVAEGVEFKRQALVNVQAIKLNDYGPVIKVLKERRYLCKSGSGVALTFAGYRWMCKQIPDDMTPLPYTSLGNPVETGGKPTTTVNNR